MRNWIHNSVTSYALLFLYTLSKTVNTVSILLVFDGLWHHVQNEEETPHTTADVDENLTSKRGKEEEATALPARHLVYRSAIWQLCYGNHIDSKRKKQTSIYWSRCDELKCDTLVGGGGGGESVVYWRVVGCGCGGGNAPSATTRAIIPNTLIFRALFSCTGFWHFFASLFAPVLRLHPFGARVLSSVIGFSHAALTLLRILVGNESLQSVISNVVLCSSTIDPVSICNVWMLNHTRWVLTKPWA